MSAPPAYAQSRQLALASPLSLESMRRTCQSAIKMQAGPVNIRYLLPVVIFVPACTINNSPARSGDGAATIAPEPPPAAPAPPVAAATPSASATAAPSPAPTPGPLHVPGSPATAAGPAAGNARLAACTSRTGRPDNAILGSERTLSGAMAPVVDVVPGEKLCIQAEDKGLLLSGVKFVKTSDQPQRTITITLTQGGGDNSQGATLRIDNPYALMLHYSLETVGEGKTKREHAVACPVEPNKSKETHFKGNVAHVIVSNLHLKGPGTAGSMLCQ